MKKAIIFLTGLLTGMVIILGVQQLGMSKHKVRTLFSFNEEYGRGKTPQLPSSTSEFKKSFGSIDFDWKLVGLDLEPVDLERFKGKVIFLNIWTTWCSPCIDEIPEIESLMTEFSGEVAFLLVTPEGVETVTRFVAEETYEAISFSDLPIYISNGNLPHNINKTSYPSTYIIDKKGAIRYRHSGIANWSEESVIGYIERLVSEAM